MSASKEPKTIIVQSADAGSKYTELVRAGEDVRFAVYEPGFGELPEKISLYSQIEREDLEKNERRIFVPFTRCPWPLPGKPQESNDLEQEIGAFLVDHIHLEDHRHYAMLTSWIKLTWVPELLTVSPYLYFIGPPASGKTRALETLAAIARRGILTPMLNEAPLFRLTDQCHPTFFLDEAEVYNKEDRSTIQNLLNCGYRRGQFVLRVHKNDPDQGVQMFDVFGPKALAGLGTFKQTLESRTLVTPMEKYRGQLRFRIDEKKARELRGKLLFWRWRRLAQADNTDNVDNPDNYMDVLKELSFSSGRILELVEPLLTFAGPQERELIIDLAHSIEDEKMADEQSTEEAEIVQLLIKLENQTEVGRHSQVVLRTGLIKEAFNAAREQNEKWHSNTIANLVRRLGFKKGRTGDGGRGILYDKELLKRLIDRYALNTIQLSEVSESSALSVKDSPALPEDLDPTLRRFIREDPP